MNIKKTAPINSKINRSGIHKSKADYNKAPKLGLVFSVISLAVTASLTLVVCLVKGGWQLC